MKKRTLRGLYSPELLESRIAPATFLVTHLLDAGAGSLRDAIEQANVQAGKDTIAFDRALDGDIVLTTGQIAISETLVIKGTGADKISVNGNAASRIFFITDDADETDQSVTISGITLHNGLGTTGGAIFSKESLSLSKVIIVNNVATLHGGGLNVYTGNDKAKLTIKDSVLSGNTADGDGGALYADVDGGILISKTIISGNSATDEAGGLHLRSDLAKGKIVVDSSTIVSNRADGEGGALLLDANAEGGQSIVKNSTISGNSAGTGGGAFTQNGAVTMSKVTFANNTADRGGAIAGNLYDKVSISSSTFVGNRATGADGGGALYLSGFHTVSVQKSVFSGNVSAGEGGAIRATYSTLLQVTSSTIEGNTAAGSGGGIAVDDRSSLLLSSSKVSGNASLRGGGVFATGGGYFEVKGGSFEGNRATYQGGAIASSGTGADLMNVGIVGTLFSGNHALYSGGAVDTTGDGIVFVKGARLIGNVTGAGFDGGGMYLRSSASVTVLSSLFQNNHAGDDGGGLAVAGPVIEVSSSKFLGNTAVDVGGGIAIFDAGATFLISKSTVSGNVAGRTGGGVANYSGLPMTLTGSKVFENFAPVDANLYGPVV